MITTEALASWLSGLVPDGPKVVVGPDMPDKPDHIMMVARGPGGRSEMEQISESGTLTIRARGLPTRSAMPELDLDELRAAIAEIVGQIDFGRHAILSIWPSGPWYPLPGPDSGRRYEFVQVFQYKTSTDI